MSPRKPRSFCDTNILFSGFYGAGPPATLLARHVAGDIQIIVSRQVLTELVRAVQRKAPRALPPLRMFLTASPPTICADPTPAEIRWAERCINRTDAPILAAAVKSGADCLVSGNTRHFTPEAGRCVGIDIVTPAAYLAMLNASTVTESDPS